MITENTPMPADKQQTQAPDGAERAKSEAVYRPQVDILEGPEALELVVDLPGADESDTEIDLDKNVLTIRASVKPPVFEGYAPLYSEYGVGDFERAFTISNEIDREGIEASMKDGVLHVRLPKAKAAGTQKIAVKAGG